MSSKGLVLVLLCLSGMISITSAQIRYRSTPPDFVAPLEAAQVVGDLSSDAEGQVLIRLINLGDTLSYRVMVSDIENVVSAHIHLGPRGANGPIVAHLAGPFPPGEGFRDGVLATGIIEREQLVGPLTGISLYVLNAAMRTDGSYVDIHTDDGIDSGDNGPGDYPDGELRGQIKQARDRTPLINQDPE
jgi:hypothetical protein